MSLPHSQYVPNGCVCRQDEDIKIRKKEKPVAISAFDYSKWDSLEREMQKDEEEENCTRVREANAAVRRQEMQTYANHIKDSLTSSHTHFLKARFLHINE